MTASRYVVIDGKRYLWRDLLRIRQEQRKVAKKEQPTLFPRKEDIRAPSQQIAAGRYQEPTLFGEG